MVKIGGRWVASKEIDWDTFPAKVDGVISERLGQLDDQLRQILNIGCVEGDIFTSNVVADVLHIDHVNLLSQLNKDLDKRHQLVKEMGQNLIGASLIAQYRISHSLIQQYLYKELGESERRQLHLKVGESLEKLFKGHIDVIDNQLALHLSRAGMIGKTINYHKIAAQRAHTSFAYQEVLAHVNEALNLIDADDLSQHFELLLLRESANGIMANRPDQFRDLRKIQDYN